MLAREVAVAATVLLRNEDDLLPIDPSTLRRVAVLGRLARVPNLGDRGSSNVHPPDVVTPLEGLQAALPDAEVVHADDDVVVADGADLTVVVVGYTHADEGEYVSPEGTVGMFHLFPPVDHPHLGVEAADIPTSVTADDPSLHPTGDDDALMMGPGGDRASLRLSAHDEALIAAAADVSDQVVVVVMAGSAVVMPWLDTVPTALLIWYPGMEGGHALADVLLGAAEPTGRLPFAIPLDEHDLVPFDNTADKVTYDLLHGQWWLDDRGLETHLPFGFGLGYTAFDLADPRLEDVDGATSVSVEVRNVGDRSGSAVVQVFGAVVGSQHRRPPRRLVGFAKVALDPGEKRRVRIRPDLDQLRVRLDGGWVVEDAPVDLTIGGHAHDRRLTVVLER
jgi:beta-glucosidase